MAEGKILFTDLFDEKLLAEIAKLRTEISGTLKDLQALKSTLPKTGNKAGDTEKLTTAQKERIKLEEKLRTLETEEYQNNEKLKAQIKERLSQKQAEGSAYKTLNKELSDNIKKYKDLAAAEKAGTDEGKKLLKTIQDQDTKIKQIDKSIGQHQRNVGNYKDIWGGFIGVFSKVIGSLGAVGVSFAAIKKVMNTTEEGADKLKFMMAGLERGIGSIYRTIATGDFSNLITNLAKAYDVGKNYAEMLDRIEHRQQALQYLRTDEIEQLAKLEESGKNRSLTDSERLQSLQQFANITKAAFEREKILSKQSTDASIYSLQMKGKENEEVRKLFDQYLRLDALNPTLRSEAEKYNQLIEQRNVLQNENGQQIISTGSSTTSIYKDNSLAIKKVNDEMSLYNNEVKQYAELLNEIEGEKKGERISAVIEGLKRENELRGAFFNENKRIISMTHGLENELSESRKKQFEEQTKRDEEKQKQLTQEQIDIIDLEESYKKLQNAVMAYQLNMAVKKTEEDKKQREKEKKEVYSLVEDITNKLHEENVKRVNDNKETNAANAEDFRNYAMSVIESSTQMGMVMGELLADQKANAEDFLRAMLILILDATEQIIFIKIAELTATSIASKKWAGIAEAAILAAIIKGTFAFAKAKVRNFEEGGVDIQGRRHRDGGIAAEIEGGESVINRHGTMRARKTLELINQGKITDNMILPALAMRAAGQMGGTFNNSNVVSEIKKTNELLGKFKFYSQDGRKVMDIHGNLVRYV